MVNRGQNLVNAVFGWPLTVNKSSFENGFFDSKPLFQTVLNLIFCKIKRMRRGNENWPFYSDPGNFFKYSKVLIENSLLSNLNDFCSSILTKKIISASLSSWYA